MSNKNYLLVGDVTKIDGRRAKCRRRFDGSGTLSQMRSAAIEELHKRKDNGSPWYGDSVHVVTPNGYEVEVEISWPVAEEWK